MLDKRIEMHTVRRNKCVKTRLSFGQKAHDFLILFFERSNIHGFFYFSLEVLRVIEKFVYLTDNRVFDSTFLKVSHFADYFGLRW